MPKRVRKTYTAPSKIARIASVLTKRKTRHSRSRYRMYRKKGRYMSVNMHCFKRYTNAQTFQIAAPLTELDQCQIFQFAHLINSSEFTTLYDRYKLTGVTMKFQLINDPDSSYDPTGVSNTGSTFFPKLWWIRDYDDSSTETLDQFRQRAGVKYTILKPNKEVKIFVKPAILTQLYSTATTTGYSPKWNQWIDIGNTNVPHYGLKWIFDTNGIAARTDRPWYLRVEMQYRFSCKDVR